MGNDYILAVVLTALPAVIIVLTLLVVMMRKWARTQPPGRKLTSAQIDETAIREMDGGVCLLSIPKKDIVVVTSDYGFTSERPAMQLVFGVCLVVGGLLPWILAWTNSLGYEDWEHLLRSYPHAPRDPRAGVFLMGIFLIPFGAYTILSALRRATYVKVLTREGWRKINLPEQRSQHTVENLLKEAQRLGYPVEEKHLRIPTSQQKQSL